MKFLKKHIEEILAKRLDHVDETGYVKVFTNDDHEIEYMTFKVKSSFDRSKFEKLSIPEMEENGKPIGKLYFKIFWKGTEMTTKLYINYHLTPDLLTKVNLLFETIEGMIEEERSGYEIYSLDQYDFYLRSIYNVKCNSFHPNGREHSLIKVSQLYTLIGGIKLLALSGEGEILHTDDEIEPEDIMLWLNKGDRMSDESDLYHVNFN